MFLGHHQTNSPVIVRIIMTQLLIAVVIAKIEFMGVAINLFLIFTVCSLVCDAGYIPDDNCFQCVLNDSCEAFAPCQNGGNCVLGSSPDEFTCDCKNHYDATTNCSGKSKDRIYGSDY